MFFTRLHSYLHPYIWQSSRLKEKAIVMSWLWDLQITGYTWSSHINLTITQPTRDLSNLSSLPLLWTLFIPLHYHYKLISLVPTRPPISTSSFWTTSPMRCMWTKVVYFDHWFTKTTCRLTSFKSGSGGARKIFSYSTRKSHWKKLQVK